MTFSTMAKGRPSWARLGQRYIEQVPTNKTVVPHDHGDEATSLDLFEAQAHQRGIEIRFAGAVEAFGEFDDGRGFGDRRVTNDHDFATVRKTHGIKVWPTASKVFRAARMP